MPSISCVGRSKGCIHLCPPLSTCCRVIRCFSTVVLYAAGERVCGLCLEGKCSSCGSVRSQSEHSLCTGWSRRVPGGQSWQGIWAEKKGAQEKCLAVLLQFCSSCSWKCEASSEAAPSEHNTNPSLSLPVREKLVTLVSLVLQDHREKRYGVLLHNPALGAEVQ